MFEERGLGNKKINRVNVSLSNDYKRKLKMMARACEMSPTTLAGILIMDALDDPVKMYALQDAHCKYEAYRVRVFKAMGYTHFELPGGRTEL